MTDRALHPMPTRPSPFLAAALLLAAACHGGGAPAGPAPVAPSLGADVAVLAADAWEGRETGTPGNDSAAAFLARRYAALRLPSPLADGSHRQPFVARAAADQGTRWAQTGRPTQNVVALIPGTDPALRGQYVVLGAHFDHLGRSTSGALDPQAGDAIRNGADDNASGTAAVLELARRFAERPARRSIVVAHFSGEELGLLGAQHFVERAPMPLDSVQAMLNFDMVGRLRDDRLIVYGTGTAAELPAVLAQANVAPALKLAPVADGFGPSDHSAFYARGIPVLHFFTDVHEDYHRATDEAARVDVAGLARVVDYAERVARDVADRPQRLTAVRAATPAPVAGAARSAGGAVYFGSVPDMAATDGTGLRLTGVTPGSPADQAGVRTGDVVIEFGGRPVTDLQSYTDALRSRKPGDVVEVVVLRDGRRVVLTATLRARGG